MTKKIRSLERIDYIADTCTFSNSMHRALRRELLALRRLVIKETMEKINAGE